MIRCNGFRAGGLAEVAEHALHEQLTGLAEATLGCEFHTTLDLYPFGAGLVATATVAAHFGLWEELVEFPLNFPGVAYFVELIAMMGRVGEKQEVDMHPLFDKYLAAQLGSDFVAVGPANHDTAGTTDPLKAADALDSWVAGMPKRLYHRE